MLWRLSARNITVWKLRCCSSYVSEENVKSFYEIPGPVRLPLVGSILPYVLGVKDSRLFHHHIVGLFKKYGPIVREDYGHQALIHVFDPDAIKKVYENDGKIPKIFPLQPTVQKYRKEKEMSLGLGNINGEEWYILRRAVQKMMLRPIEVGYYVPLQDKVACYAMQSLQDHLCPDGCVEKLENFIGRWILESSGICCFETSLGCLKEEGEQAKQLIDANKEIFKLTGKLKFSLDLLPESLSPSYRRLHKLEDFFYGVLTEFINEAIGNVKKLLSTNELSGHQYNFLAYLLRCEDLSEKDIITITFSLLTDGMSTTAPTFLANLYCLALFQEVQQKVFEEVSLHIPLDGPITSDVLGKMVYMKAFVKEVFRFYPIGESVQRVLQKELVLSGYAVPAETWLNLSPYVWLLDSSFYQHADRFMPERWIRKGKDFEASAHPYILNPFSIGTRMCAGRRFAEQDIYIGICRILQKFRLSTAETEMPEQEWATLLRPKSGFPLTFHHRKDPRGTTKMSA